MANSKTRWGWNQVDGVWFFFEPNRPTQELCPLPPPKETLFCPHKTPQNEKPLPYNSAKIYWTNDKVKFKLKYEVKHSRIKYFGVGTLREMYEMSKETNYVPIIVSGVKITPDWYNFAIKLEQFVETQDRSVVLELVDEFIPVLPNWVKLKNLKRLGLQRS